ncbi:MAG: hypothetical protein ACQETH_05575 [Candidatus Rifleibacteriota bacterium]
MSETLVVKCNKCSQKIALPYDFDSPVFLCPRCQNKMTTPPEIFSSPPEAKNSQPDLLGQTPSSVLPQPPPEKQQSQQPPSQTISPQSPQSSNKQAPTKDIPPSSVETKTPAKTLRQPDSGSSRSTNFAPADNAASAKKKGTRAQLVEKVGEVQLKECLKAYVENSLSHDPIPRAEFTRRLMKAGMDTQTAAALIAYAQKSDEGKKLALETSWTYLIYGSAAIILGILANIFTIVATGYIVHALVAVPIIGLLTVVISGQKILAANFPIVNTQAFKTLLAFIFLMIVVGGIYFAVR